MIDTHAHVASELFDQNRDDVIGRARSSGVSAWVEVGTDLEQSRKAIALAEKNESVVASVGVHPDDIGTLTEEGWNELEQLAAHNKVRAIGEVGLDFFRGGVLQDQEEVLRRFIALAHRRTLPIIFHVRSGDTSDAHAELIRILASIPSNERPAGVIHTFSGTLSQAKEYVDLGLYISFSGVITFKKAGELPQVATEIEESRILVETDCPFLAPEPFRGKQNEPAYVRYVIEKIAALRNRSFEEMEKITEQNARTLFGFAEIRGT